MVFQQSKRIWYGCSGVHVQKDSFSILTCLIQSKMMEIRQMVKVDWLSLLDFLVSVPSGQRKQLSQLSWWQEQSFPNDLKWRYAYTAKPSIPTQSLCSYAKPTIHKVNNWSLTALFSLPMWGTLIGLISSAQHSMVMHGVITESFHWPLSWYYFSSLLQR